MKCVIISEWGDSSIMVSIGTEECLGDNEEMKPDSF